MQSHFPIDSLREEIKSSLVTNNRLIIKAPTGSGKSTRVPQFILDEVSGTKGQVLVLQPRRMAARLLAGFIARERGKATGEEVGYQLRMESRKSNATRILFVTEGILLRRLLGGDSLDEVHSIIFDEFHERHLETDLGLALAMRLQQSVRPDLIVTVMSATLETDRLAEYMSPVSILETSGKSFPVHIHYSTAHSHEQVWDHAVRALQEAVSDWQNGSALVFMPGIHEIRKTMEKLSAHPNLAGFDRFPLHGSLSAEEQDAAVRVGGRKIIVATNVAETSITIPDIRLVVDSGLARIARFDSRKGINTLSTEPVSKSSADQRAGRAGRVASGTCIRLWSEFSHAGRSASDKPEIHRVDLSEAVLGLCASGYKELNHFPWFQAPEAEMLKRCYELLRQLGALDENLQITAIGIKMASLPMHPRFSRMLLLAEEMNCLPAAAVLAALAQSSSIFTNTNDPMVLGQREMHFGGSGSDLLFEFNALLWAGNNQFRQSDCNNMGIHSTGARQVVQLAAQILRSATGQERHAQKLPLERLTPAEEEHLKKCILVAFSDFIAVRHRMESPTCQMMHGKGGQLAKESSVQDHKILVATEVEEKKINVGMQVILRKVTAIEEEWIRELNVNGWEDETRYLYDEASKRVVLYAEEKINGLVICKSQTEAKDQEEISKVFTKAIMEGSITFPQWDEKTNALVRRLNFASAHAVYLPIPGIDEEAKFLIIQQTIYHCKTLKEVQRTDIGPAIRDYLSSEQWKEVNRLAPESIQLPLRKKPTYIRYEENGDVILSETVQALYDCPTDIRIADGKVRLKFEILSPARRPVQITSDLSQFWKTSYQEVKKEMKGRYPKHEWR